MPNLVGIWAPAAGADEVRRSLAIQLDRVDVPGIDYARYRDVHAGFAMGLLDHGILENGPQPARIEGAQASLMLDGEVTNLAELRRRHRAHLPGHDMTPPEICLRLFLAFGPDIALQLNGVFCIVVFEPETGRLTAMVDRFGCRPLYFAERSGRVLFGSEIKALAAIDPQPRRIDEVGTFQQFAFETHLGDSTWIEGYRRLGPACVMTVDRGGLRIRRYWRYAYDETAPKLDQQSYHSVYRTLLDRAVERAMQGTQRIGMFLSGGYDSRCVAAAIRPHHLPIPAFTFGLAESRDVRFARMLADRLNIDHHVLNFTEPHLYPNCHAIVWRTEGMGNFAPTTSIHYHRVMKDRMDIFLTGFLGEFSGSHTWPGLLVARSRRAVMEGVFTRLQGGRQATLRRILNPAFYSRAAEAAHDFFENSFAEIDNDQPLNVADSWRFMIERRPPFVAPSLDRYLFEMRAPLLDADLVDFLLTIPPMARLEQRVYKKMIAYGFPQVRDIPCTNSGTPINPNFADEYMRMVARFAGRKAVAPLRSMLGLRRGLGRETSDMDDDLRAEPALIESVLRPMLRDGIFPSELFDHAGIEAIVDEQFNSKGAHWAPITALITWGLAARYFLHDDLSEVPETMYRPRARES
jgi:asparagine synthase (glutamine-hydrolysing)